MARFPTLVYMPSVIPRSKENVFIFFSQQKQGHCDAMRECTQSINCCLTSNPCFNNGTCSPTDNIQDRFTCACPTTFIGKNCKRCAPGYSGKNCDTRITSCRGYANGSRTSGVYHIFDSDNVIYKVFCDFEKDSNLSWTLVQSYSIENKKMFNKPFFSDLSKNAENPLENWYSYRIPKVRMESIQTDSTKWRVTCEFDKDKTAIKTDLMQGSKKDVDIMTYDVFGECKRFEYINVRGYNCSNCTAALYQRQTYPLHSDARGSIKLHCDLKVANYTVCPFGQGTSGEDNFGLYQCQNKQHRCSATSKSTTQTWLGG